MPPKLGGPNLFPLCAIWSILNLTDSMLENRTNIQWWDRWGSQEQRAFHETGVHFAKWSWWRDFQTQRKLLLSYYEIRATFLFRDVVWKRIFTVYFTPKCSWNSNVFSTSVGVDSSQESHPHYSQTWHEILYLFALGFHHRLQRAIYVWPVVGIFFGLEGLFWRDLGFDLITIWSNVTISFASDWAIALRLFGRIEHNRFSPVNNFLFVEKKG